VKFATSGNLPTAIKGFCGETAVVFAEMNKGRRTGAWVFEARCGTVKTFKPEYFHDPRGAAMAALERHRHKSD
jgi:hypothetical protein